MARCRSASDFIFVVGVGPFSDLGFELDVDLLGDHLGHGGVEAEFLSGGFLSAGPAFPVPAGGGE